MVTSARSTLAISVLALAISASGASGQQNEITTQEAEAYFRQLQQEATEIVGQQDFDRLDEWIEENVADGAVWQASLTIITDGKRKGFAEMTFDKSDLSRLSPFFASAFQQRISDYSLEVTVNDVVPHGSDTATATVEWTERFSIDVAGDDSETEQDERQFTFEAVATCTHLLQRTEDSFALGLSTCTGEVRL
jgi:hypothetical protein